MQHKWSIHILLTIHKQPGFLTHEPRNCTGGCHCGTDVLTSSIKARELHNMGAKEANGGMSTLQKSSEVWFLAKAKA